MALTTRIVAQIVATLTNARDLDTAEVPLNVRTQIDLASGVGANQADKIFSDTRTLAASATEDLDLAAVLADALGGTLTFARVKGIWIRAAAANTNNVVVGGQASNGFLGPFGAAAHTIAVRPGGVFLIVAPDVTGWVVTPSTGDLLKIANSSSGSAVTYDVVIIGASA